MMIVACLIALLIPLVGVSYLMFKTALFYMDKDNG